jgi:hypothetical protein
VRCGIDGPFLALTRKLGNLLANCHDAVTVGKQVITNRTCSVMITRPPGMAAMLDDTLNKGSSKTGQAISARLLKAEEGSLKSHM